MAHGSLPDKIAAPLLLAAACFDFLVLVSLTAPLATRIKDVIPNYQPELITAGSFFSLLFVYWVATELILGGRTLGRLVLQLNMIGKNGQRATRMQRTARAILKFSTLGLSGLQVNGPAHYDKKAKIAWTSPLAPKPRRPIAAWQLVVDSGPEKGKSITFGRTSGFQHSQTIKIGRDRAWSDLTLNQVSNVSSKHAMLSLRDGTARIMDSGSTNGTTVSGRKIAPKKWISIGNVDHFHIANIKIRLIR